MKMKGISPMISSVILILIVISLATIISPWVFDLVMNTTTTIGDDTISDIQCQDAAYDFVTSYGTYGVDWNFTDQAHNLNVSIKNTGTITLYNFTIEITHNTTIISVYNVTSATQKTKANPLKPSQTYIIAADISEDLNGTLNSVTVLNGVCPGKSITNDNF